MPEKDVLAKVVVTQTTSPNAQRGPVHTEVTATKASQISSQLGTASKAYSKPGNRLVTKRYVVGK